jgi:hypothetical protein
MQLMSKPNPISLTCTLFASISISACAPPNAKAGDVEEIDCAKNQCLVLDFLKIRNNHAGSLDQGVSAFGEFLNQDSYGAASMRSNLCKVIPSTECFSRVISLRQKIYTDSTGVDIGCVVVGGIAKDDRAYRSFGIIYQNSGNQWRAMAINYFQSLNETPSARDLLTDPCPPRKR